jgi:hypothetical protein
MEMNDELKELNGRSSNFVLNKIVAAPHRPTTTSATSSTVTT